jgi:aryl-alcohol dehydrogenase-like predicted oxidoreductase
MSYGRKSWAEWLVEEEEAIAQIKMAWEAGINVCFSLVSHFP